MPLDCGKWLNLFVYCYTQRFLKEGTINVLWGNESKIANMSLLWFRRRRSPPPPPPVNSGLGSKGLLIIQHTHWRNTQDACLCEYGLYMRCMSDSGHWGDMVKYSNPLFLSLNIPYGDTHSQDTPSNIFSWQGNQPTLSILGNDNSCCSYNNSHPIISHLWEQWLTFSFCVVYLLISWSIKWHHCPWSQIFQHSLMSFNSSLKIYFESPDQWPCEGDKNFLFRYRLECSFLIIFPPTFCNCFLR